MPHLSWQPNRPGCAASSPLTGISEPTSLTTGILSTLSPDAPAIDRDLYPFAGHFFDTGNGVRLHFLDEGAGLTVVMVHGNPTWSCYYRDLVRPPAGPALDGPAGPAAGGVADVPEPVRVGGQPDRGAQIRADNAAETRRDGIRQRPGNGAAATAAGRQAGADLLGHAGLRLRRPVPRRMADSFPRRRAAPLRRRGALHPG